MRNETGDYFLYEFNPNRQSRFASFLGYMAGILPLLKGGQKSFEPL
jgi:hypothetical protein